MGEKSLVGQLGLVLKSDPVPGFVESPGMLQDHDFKHCLGFWVREFALVDEGIDMGV